KFQHSERRCLTGALPFACVGIITMHQERVFFLCLWDLEICSLESEGGVSSARGLLLFFMGALPARSSRGEVSCHVGISSRVRARLPRRAVKLGGGCMLCTAGSSGDVERFPTS